VQNAGPTEYESIRANITNAKIAGITFEVSISAGNTHKISMEFTPSTNITDCEKEFCALMVVEDLKTRYDPSLYQFVVDCAGIACDTVDICPSVGRRRREKTKPGVDITIIDELSSSTTTTTRVNTPRAAYPGFSAAMIAVPMGLAAVAVLAEAGSDRYGGGTFGSLDFSSLI